jgi:hypothetical protein
MATRPTRRLLLPALGLGLALTLAACSSSSNPPATTTTPAPASTTSTTAAGGTTVTSGTLTPETATGSEFYSPSKNISCEIDSGTQVGTSTLCLTINPARSVVLHSDGTLTVCTGQDCLSNAGVNTPTLPYGYSITIAPFMCVSSTAGITCTVTASGAGFLIATSGVTSVGGATVTSS